MHNCCQTINKCCVPLLDSLINVKEHKDKLSPFFGISK